MLLKVSDRAALWFWLPLVASAPPPISQELGNQCTLTLLPSLTTTCPGGTCHVSQHSPMADLDPAVHLAGPRLLARLLRVVVGQQEADVEEQEQEHGGREAQGGHHQPLLQLHGEW